LGKALLTLNMDLASAGKEHPVASSLLDALPGAAVGAATGLGVQRIKAKFSK